VECVRESRKFREKPEGKRILGSIRSRLEDNIEKYFEEHVAFFCEHDNEHSSFIKLENIISA
jgi:hypothetical protein